MLDNVGRYNSISGRGGTPKAPDVARSPCELRFRCFLRCVGFWCAWQLFMFARPAAFSQEFVEPYIDDGETVQLERLPLAQATPYTPEAAAIPSQRRVRVFPRSSVRWQARWFPSEDGTERIGVVDSGVNIVIENLGGFDTIDISTDRVVIWTPADQVPDLAGNNLQEGQVPLEFYMEGHIVFRQADRVIYADRMYYNVHEEYGVVLNSEMLTPMPGYQGLVRVKAEVLRQVDRHRFEGHNAAFTTSRIGLPRYWLQSTRFSFQEYPPQPGDPVSIDPYTGMPVAKSQKRVASRSNLVYLGNVPVFYWPFMAGNLERPTYYLESFSINNDNVFGTQVLTEWNLYQLLGFQRAPVGTNWTGSLDYLSERGLGGGSYFEYDRNSLLGHQGHTFGFLDAWGIYDTGLDNLGARRRMLEPETDSRGRLYGRHRQQLHDGYQITAELGAFSDRNFQEQYYEEDWDQEKSATTGLEFKKTRNNHSWAFSADARVNDFFTQTERLPQFDHFWLGQSLLGDYLVWSEHTSVGYAAMRTTTFPEDPFLNSNFSLLPWEADVEGVNASTRQELSLPFTLGPGKLVPYVLGEYAYWKQDLLEEEATRSLGQIGLRSSVGWWRTNPGYQNVLFNINGLAHKVILESDLFYGVTDIPLDTLPLYDPLDDDAVQFARRQFYTAEYGGAIPLPYDERNYAYRSGMQGWVTAPSTEIADDLVLWRTNLRQRWQTKRGAPGRQRVVDYVTLDIGGSLFPESERDNFGELWGLINYDFAWHIGDRVSVLSDGQYDFFEGGLRTASISGLVSRPGRVRYLAGVRGIDGPFSSTVVYGSASYRLSQKWIASYGSSYDFGDTGNIGQRGELIRVGESFLVGLGFNYDQSRDNFGVRFAVEPRFFPGRMSRVAGAPIEPVGMRGLE